MRLRRKNCEPRPTITDGPLESAVLTAVSETAAMRRASSKCSRLVGGKPPSNPPRRKSWKTLYTTGSVRHSLRSTASGVLSVSRAISCVNRSSHRLHPRRLATKLAISDAPQPNSRSIVMALNHCVYPQPTATSPPAPGSFFFKKNARTNMMEQSAPKTQKISI